MSREIPLLFTGPMVRAILDGSKTQTRRLVKLPVQHDPDWTGGWKIVHKIATQAVETFNRLRGALLGKEGTICPYGQPGDRLWVRETFTDLLGTGIEHYSPEGKRQRYAYAADSPPGSWSDETRKDYGIKWKPSIHMPRAACRILLEVVSVRVERLNECSEADAKAEGVRQFGMRGDWEYYPYGRNDPMAGHICCTTARSSYESLWESLEGKGSWDANPWVWVIEFKRVTP